MKATPKYYSAFFPVCLLKEFENKQVETANRILTYCYNEIAKGKCGKVQANELLKQYGRIEFCDVRIDDTLSPTTHYNFEILFNIAHGNELDYDETCLFLYTCACRSIIGKGNDVLTNWAFISARMQGLRKPNPKIEPVGIAQRILFQTKKWKDKLLFDCYETYKIGYKSAKGLHGFYIYTGDKDEFEKRIAKVLKKDVKAGHDKRVISKAVANMTDEILYKLVEGFGYNPDKACIEYLKSNDCFGGSTKKIQEGLMKYYKIL